MKTRTKWLVALLVGAGLSLLLTIALPAGNFWASWLAGCVLGIPAIFGLLCAWQFGAQASGSSRTLAWLVALAFLLRLGLGVFFALVLPSWGYDQPTQNNGYIYSDAYSRDTLAWQMAVESQPIGTAFQQSTTDQYGGLLAASTLVYRLLSPDAHRPWLILLLAAFTAAVGVPFLWRGLQQRWGNWVSLLATCIFVFYPESLILGGAQMREPFLIGLSGVAFWAVLDEKVSARRRWLILAATLAGMVLLSPPAGLLTGLFALGWMMLDRVQFNNARRWLWLAVGLVGTLACLAVLWKWFWLASSYDNYLAERASGWLQALHKILNPTLFKIFVTGYGLVQPVLPATLFEPALPIMQIISILRALGWYLLAPFFIYGAFATWKAQPGSTRRLLVWSALVGIGWTIISSIRAGGDMWDNPRYRTLALAWMALVAAWGWQYARQKGSPWLKRTWIVTAIFVGGFIFWYFTRYVPGLGSVHIFVILGAIALTSLFVLLGGWLVDRRKAAKINTLQK